MKFKHDQQVNILTKYIARSLLDELGWSRFDIKDGKIITVGQERCCVMVDNQALWFHNENLEIKREENV